MSGDALAGAGEQRQQSGLLWLRGGGQPEMVGKTGGAAPGQRAQRLASALDDPMTRRLEA